MNSIPFEIKEATIQCFGRIFHYKDIMESFLYSCGVPKDVVKKDRDKPKFVWAKNVLSDLESLENGFTIQRKIITELNKLRNIPDTNVPNRDDAIVALRKFKELVRDYINDNQTKTIETPPTY